MATRLVRCFLFGECAIHFVGQQVGEVLLQCDVTRIS